MLGHAALSRIVAGLVRRTWLFVLVTVLACSAFAARAVASLRDTQDVDTSPPLAPPLPGRSEVIPHPRESRDGSALVTRNMFCSSCTPAVAAVGPGPADGFSPDAMLIATSVGREPVATIRVPTSEVQGSFGVGDRLPGVGTITRIGFVSVDLVDALGRRGTITLLPAATATTTNSGGRSDAGAATPAPAAAAADPWHGRIDKLDATTFAVERGLVRELVSGSMQTGGARIIPLAKDGKLDGLRLVGVRGGSLASAVGLATGDVLQAINNTRIESANTLLDLYAQLDRLQSVELAGTRAGKPMTLTLRLR
jgi:hypothetical protein